MRFGPVPKLKSLLRIFRKEKSNFYWISSLSIVTKIEDIPLDLIITGTKQEFPHGQWLRRGPRE